jgi:hypothetical protein
MALDGDPGRPVATGGPQSGGPIMEGRDAYEVLGVPPEADFDTLRNAYRALARRYHPDGIEPNPARMIEVNRPMSRSTVRSAAKRTIRCGARRCEHHRTPRGRAPAGRVGGRCSGRLRRHRPAWVR